MNAQRFIIKEIYTFLYAKNVIRKLELTSVMTNKRSFHCMKGQENAEKNTNMKNIELGVLLKAANKS